MEEKPVKTEQRLEGGGPQLLEEAGAPGASGGSSAPRHPDFRLHPPAPEEKEFPLRQAPHWGTLVSAPRAPTSQPREGAGEGHGPGRSPGLEPWLYELSMSLGKLLNLSEPRFLHLRMGIALEPSGRFLWVPRSIL